MTHEVKVGDPVEFWFTDEQGDTCLINGLVCFVEQRTDGERPTVVCSARQVKLAKPSLAL